MVSIIVCTYNREKYLGETLERLAANCYDGAWELVLVNNNSTDSTAQICESFAAAHSEVPFRYVVETQQGLSHARNRGIVEAKGDWLVFLDDDAFVEKDYIANLQAQITKHPDAGAFGGQITPFFEDGEPKWMSSWAMGFVSAMDKGDEVCLFGNKEFPIGANMGIRREVINAVGVFNPALGRTGNNLLGGEEKDIFNRIREAGFRIYYFPGICVRHCIPGRRTTHEFIGRLGYGVGVSERMRTQGIDRKHFMMRIAIEGIKWGGTLILWCQYLLCGVRAKGDILVWFRYQVTKGLIGCSKDNLEK